MEEVFSYVNPVQIYLFVTFLIAVFFYDRNAKEAVYLYPILLSNFVAELIVLYLQLQHRPIVLLMSISSFIHNSIWLLFLINSVKQRAIHKILFAAFIIFALINFIFFEGLERFNSKTFILGAFLYLVLFIYESFYELQKEQFSFFLSNRFVLLCAPILFFQV
jgi:hypothetical protein